MDNIELDDDFHRFWNAPDAIDPTQLNCQTYLPAVLSPETISITPVQHGLAKLILKGFVKLKSHFDFDVLDRLASEPKEGYESIVLIEEVNDKTAKTDKIRKITAGPSCWLVERKNSPARVVRLQNKYSI